MTIPRRQLTLAALLCWAGCVAARADVPAFRLDTTAYGGYVDYHGSSWKDAASFGGLYAGARVGAEHLVEGEADYLAIERRRLLVLQQWDGTLAYANDQIPNWRLRLGTHYIASDDPASNGGWVPFCGVHYYAPGSWRPGVDRWIAVGRWDAGVNGYVSVYPHFGGGLDVVQLTPQVGVVLWQGTDWMWRSDLQGYWIHPGRDVGWGQRNFFSIEERLSVAWRRWAFAAFGWAGEQTFAVRNDGFTVFNLAERHRAGYGLEVKYAVTDRVSFAGRISREEFSEFNNHAVTTGNTYLAMVNCRF